MPLFHNILVAADFSESSREAFRIACLLAHPVKTRLTVFHAEEPPIRYGYQDLSITPTGADLDEQESKLCRMCNVYQSDRPLTLEHLTRQGHPAEEILRAIDEIGADLVVLGTHGRTGVQRLVAGSVAEAVLRRAHCPVVALRSPSHLPAKPDTPGVAAESSAVHPIRTILHPTDFSERSDSAFHVACSLAQEYEARLIVLFAAPTATVFGGTFPGVPTDPRIYQHAFEERLRQIRIPSVDEVPQTNDAIEQPLDGLRTTVSKILVEHRLSEGDAAVEILQVADAVEADLIVLGTHGRTGLSRVLMGSVTEAVLRGSPCPVLAVKGPICTTAEVRN